jgi:hypothetical protein
MVDAVVAEFWLQACSGNDVSGGFGKPIFGSKIIFAPSMPVPLRLIKSNRRSTAIVNHVVFQKKAFAALVNEHAVVGGALSRFAAPGIVQMIAANYGSGL